MVRQPRIKTGCELRAPFGCIKRRVAEFTASMLVVLVLAGCATDPSAVTSFAALAPDGSKLHALTEAYAAVPAELIELDVKHDLNPVVLNMLTADEKTRPEQAKSIDGLNAVLVDYMKALGALADDKLVQTSTDTKAVTDGLTNLQKAKPNLGITAAQISAIGDLSTLLADAATSIYRQEKLTDVIGRGEAPFQALVAAEKLIIGRAVIPDLNNVENRVGALDSVTSQLASDRPADVASLFLLQRTMAADKSRLDQQISAAKDYLTVLDNLGRAHTLLYNARNNVLSAKGAKVTIKQIQPLLSEAYMASQTLSKL